MHRNRNPILVALGEVVALHHARHRVARGQLDHAARAERIAPFRVVADFGLGRVQHQRGLGEVGCGVQFDLFARQRRARDVAPGRVADHRGEVADQEDHLVAQVLQLAQLVQDHRMAQVQVRRGWIEAQLDAQRHAALLGARQLLREFAFDQQFVDTALGDGEGFLDLVRQWQCGAGGSLLGRCGGCIHRVRKNKSGNGGGVEEFDIMLDPINHCRLKTNPDNKNNKRSRHRSSGKF